MTELPCPISPLALYDDEERRCCPSDDTVPRLPGSRGRVDPGRRPPGSALAAVPQTTVTGLDVISVDAVAIHDTPLGSLSPSVPRPPGVAVGDVLGSVQAMDHASAQPMPVSDKVLALVASGPTEAHCIRIIAAASRTETAKRMARWSQCVTKRQTCSSRWRHRAIRSRWRQVVMRDGGPAGAVHWARYAMNSSAMAQRFRRYRGIEAVGDVAQPERIRWTCLIG